MITFAIILLLIAISYIDIKTKTISDGITLCGILVALHVQLHYGDIAACINGLSVGFSLVYSMFILGINRIGGGDAKLIAMLGAFFGWKIAVVTTLMAWILFIPFRNLNGGAGVAYAPAITVAFVITKGLSCFGI